MTIVEREVLAAARPGRASLAGQLAVAGLGAAGLAYVALRDPAQGGFVPCPLHALTGLWCPGCGMTRALHHLLHGDLAAAFSSNLFLPLVVVIVGWAWLAWARPQVPKVTHVVTARVWTWLIAAAVAYGVLRNLPVPVLQTLAP